MKTFNLFKKTILATSCLAAVAGFGSMAQAEWAVFVAHANSVDTKVVQEVEKTDETSDAKKKKTRIVIKRAGSGHGHEHMKVYAHPHDKDHEHPHDKDHGAEHGHEHPHGMKGHSHPHGMKVMINDGGHERRWIIGGPRMERHAALEAKASEKVITKLEEAIARIDEKISKTKKKKEKKALKIAKEELQVSLEEVKKSRHEFISARKVKRMSSAEMDKALTEALENVEVREKAFAEARVEIEEALSEAREEIQEALGDIDIEIDKDGEVRRFHIKALRDAEASLKMNEEQQLAAIERAERRLAEKKERIEMRLKKLEEQKKLQEQQEKEKNKDKDK